MKLFFWSFLFEVVNETKSNGKDVLWNTVGPGLDVWDGLPLILLAKIGNVI